MPEPTRAGQRYMPGLDGLRTLAVSAVIAYHLGFGWASGGLLGVGVFFTLSGYLITDLLLGQLAEQRLRLTEFWLRRARRLLPGLFVMLVVVTVWVGVADRGQLSALRGELGSALLYVNNWWQISQHLSYFARFGPPSPLNHLWSLSVEEQFYILWPWLLLLGVHLVAERRRPIRVRPRLAGVTLVLALVSAIEMTMLFHPSFDPSRIYYGTDTRAFGLLVGAALAMVWPSRSLTTRVSGSARNIVDGLGVAGLLGIAVLVWRTNEYSPFLYHGGLVLLSLATVLVVAALAHPAARLGGALGWRPLRWLGVRSYGIYLWQTPVILLTTPVLNRGVDPLRAVAQVAAIVGVAALSWHYVEEPVRHGALGRLWAQVRDAGRRPRVLPTHGRAAMSIAVVALAFACLALAGVRAPAPITSAIASLGGLRDTVAASAPGAAARSDPGRPQAGVAGPTGGSAASDRAWLLVLAAARAARNSDPSVPRTSCRAVVHIGDSTSEGMISSDYLPDPSQRLEAQYARVGVRQVDLEITGGTSIVETLPGTVDAYDVARRLRSGGYRGCWVIALGTNDTADVYVGSSISLRQRIERMMSVIGNQPVMWVNAKTLVSSGPYAESNMRRFNQALVSACSEYANMRVYDWASAARDRWFIPDGIHYYSPGYAARAHLIADALADAFPASGASPAGSCVVSTGSISLPVLGIGR
ncbi:MAG: acyltransferase family protein [Solirubrobacteraceae bacterium]